MSLPPLFDQALRLPVIVAPMFLISGPTLVLACCRAGVAGTFPTLNTRTNAQLDQWLDEISDGLSAERSNHHGLIPYGVNLIVHKSNTRLHKDLNTIVKHRVPFVITSLGHPGEVIEAVHTYGGLVFSDVVNTRFAHKVINAGVDGVIAITSGAGGHAGIQHPFSLIRSIRSFWPGPLALGGAISDGASIRAALALGADFAYMGTRFLATEESMASKEYKQMLVNCSAQDIVYTDAVSGINANFLAPSLQAAGLTSDILQQHKGEGRLDSIFSPARPWADIWSAGHGVSLIDDIPAVSELVERLIRQFSTSAA